MKVFVAVCIFSVMLALSAAVYTEREVEEDSLVHPSAQEADLEEGLRNLVLAAYDNLEENDVAAEEPRYPTCLPRCGVFPFCRAC